MGLPDTKREKILINFTHYSMINHWVKILLLIIHFFTHLLKNGSSIHHIQNISRLARKVPWLMPKKSLAMHQNNLMKTCQNSYIKALNNINIWFFKDFTFRFVLRREFSSFLPHVNLAFLKRRLGDKHAWTYREFNFSLVTSTHFKWQSTKKTV